MLVMLLRFISAVGFSRLDGVIPRSRTAVGFITMNDRDLHVILANRGHGRSSKIRGDPQYRYLLCMHQQVSVFVGQGIGRRRSADNNKAFWNLEASVSSLSRSAAKVAVQLPHLFIETAEVRALLHICCSDEEWVMRWELNSWSSPRCHCKHCLGIFVVKCFSALDRS